MEPKKGLEGVKDGVIDDGLDLDQIQEGQFGVLFLGTDESRSNTDVMMLAMFDIRANEIHILQIPRDTFVPGYTSFEAGKINSVYKLGNPDKQPVQRVVDCLETLFRVPIDRYITTSCNDIAEIVDLIGGVPIDMPYTITYEADKIINQGRQVLSGQQAEWMVRFRHDYSEGDIGRMKAQRIFMAAAMAKISEIGSIEMLGYINKIVDKKLIGSNLTVDEISKLSDFASTIGMEKITMHMLPGEGYNYYPPDPGEIEYYSVWMMHKQPVIDLLNQYFRPYFEPENDLPIVEMLTPDQYQSTLYDNDMTDFQRIEDGDTFMGG
jgi:LCP family protein required for cell wall assembly